MSTDLALNQTVQALYQNEKELWCMAFKYWFDCGPHVGKERREEKTAPQSYQNPCEFENISSDEMEFN